MRRISLILAASLAIALPAHAADDTATVIRELGLKEADAPVRSWKGWKAPKKIVVVVDGGEDVTSLTAIAPGVKLVPVRSVRDAMAELKDADGVVGACSPDVIKAAPNLRWIHSGSAGVERCVNDPGIQSGKILLTNMQRVNGGVMAEHVIALMMAMTRQLPAYMRAQEQENFAVSLLPQSQLWEISGRTMLVAGLGGIGTEVAKRAHGLGMKVIATRNSGTGGPDYVSYVGKADELGKLVAQADVVVDALPLTADTRNVFNADIFGKMRKGSFFINVGRGGTVDHDALAAVLNNGKLNGAGLDVTSPEPLPKGHPLWKAKNIIITPHVSAFSDIRDGRGWVISRENLRRYVAGEKMLSVVVPERGY